MDNASGALDLLSIGDASMDVYISPSEMETLCQLNNKDSLICFSYGDKIPIKSVDFSVGGNAANNAVGVSRLGLRAGLVATLGDDRMSNQILDRLREENVDLTYTIQQKNTPSNYSLVINYSGERTIFTYHAPRDYEFPSEMLKTAWIYLTSMGENFESFYTKLLEFLLKNSDIKLAYNPGSWQLRAPYEHIKTVMEKTHLIYVNREEAEMLTKTSDTRGKEKDLLKALSSIGPKISVITDGSNGSFVYDGQRFVRAGVLPVDAYERTGAGDAFGSGCLAAIMKGKGLEEALLWGTLNSASKIGYVGPQKGLLHDSEMPSWIDRARSSGVVVEEF